MTPDGPPGSGSGRAAGAAGSASGGSGAAAAGSASSGSGPAAAGSAPSGSAAAAAAGTDSSSTDGPGSSAGAPSPSRRRNGTRRGEPWTAAEIREEARNRLIESRLTPNAISLTGFVGNVIAAVLVTQRYFFLAGIAFILGSVCDTLDGRYSRMSGKGTPFGAFLDSTLDRVEEGIVLTAVAAYFSSRGNDLAVAAVVVTVLMSLMVSYTRARAEALGVECKVGLATRPVRVVILSAGLLFAKGASLGDFELLEPAIYAMAVLTTFTTLQRVLHVRRELNKQFAA